MSHVEHHSRLKYCSTCDIYRPFRSTHCGTCDSCIERLDHHCPWLGTCIGKRNYKHFFLFVNALGVYIAFVFASSVYEMLDRSARFLDASENADASKSDAFGAALSESPAPFFLSLYCVLVSMFVYTLCFYHHRLVYLNSTTNEDLKKHFRGKLQGNPHHSSYCNHLNVLVLKHFVPNWNPRGIFDSFLHVT